MCGSYVSSLLRFTLPISLWYKQKATMFIPGNHECEVLGQGPEATESAYAWKNCTKNPGHSQFIPAPEFCLDHLPKWCADPTVVECVRAISALTVRLRVNYTSWGRPDGYSFANHRGSNILHTGSGWVRDIKVGSGPCRCPECQQSSFPKQVWYEVHLETACHVVYNTEEAQATKADFFYDDEGSREEGWTETIHAVDNIVQDADGDSCVLLCATHNQGLAEMLRMYLKKVVRYRFKKDDDICFPTPWRYLCVIVSHPHGQAKKVTVGKCKPNMKKHEFFRSCFTYNTPTCPGSSGAPVLTLGFKERGQYTLAQSDRSLLPPHSQWLKAQKLNQSAATSTRYNSESYLHILRVLVDALRD